MEAALYRERLFQEIDICVSVSAVCGFSRLQRWLQIKGVERGSGDVSLTGNDVIDRLLLPLGEMLFRRQA